ncbi:uncharacterized protein LOC120358794 isoform X2 [Solenopsis invicta]|uniref:uncharacterized protein LOC120358794 isoform X2 n=1 Tax=Solenopsis invicta TaxID=13686 RepID=UPI00193D6E37|nr:uncharacterized protein LOC120358794 isoform X2 [Solenopsis invicta]
MPNKCIVPGCNTDYATCKIKLSVFSAPKDDERRKEWEEKLQLIKPLLAKHFVCEKHFRTEDIIKSYKHKDEKSNVLLEIPNKRAQLVKDAVPIAISPQHIGNKENLQENENITDEQLNIVPISQPLIEVSQNLIEDTKKYQRRETVIEHNNLFTELLNNPSVIKIPTNWYCTSSKKQIVLFEIYLQNYDNISIYPTTRRSLTIDHNMKTFYLISGKRVNLSVFSFSNKFENLENINDTVKKFASLNICCGISMNDDVNLVKGNIGYTNNSFELRHNRSPIITDGRQCEACKSVKKCILRKKQRIRKRSQICNKKTTIEHQTLSLSSLWKKKFHRQQCALKRSKIRLETLKKLVLSQQAKINKLKEEDVIQKCEVLDMPEIQKTCIKEIMAAARLTNSKGRRYTNDWIMLCILMHIRSPINIKCGFDKHFCEIFKKFIEKKTSLQKHGLLLIDEISLRESISVNSSNLTYKGLVDFCEDGKKAKCLDEKATSGLVLMFQPLADKYTQPIAVFASRGPVKGVELAKLVIQAIIFLENAGVLVHGIISDGAETNRKM